MATSNAGWLLILRSWTDTARIAMAAFARLLIAVGAFALLMLVVFLTSAHLDAWDRWLIAKVLAFHGEPTMHDNVVLVHVNVGERSPGFGDGGNSYHGRRAVADFLELLADESKTPQAPAAVVLDIVFQSAYLDQAPGETLPTPSTGSPAVSLARSGFAKLEKQVGQLVKRLGKGSVYAVLNPFDETEKRLFFRSAEPWERDLKIGHEAVTYGHTAFAINDDCSVAWFWPFVNDSTHPLPKGAALPPKKIGKADLGPFEPVKSIATQVADRGFDGDLEAYAPRYFIPRPPGNAKAQSFTFSPITGQAHRFNDEEPNGIGEPAIPEFGGKTIIIGDMKGDRFGPERMRCTVVNVELLAWLISDLKRGQRSLSERLNAKDAAVSWLLAGVCALVSFGVVSRRTRRAPAAYFHDTRTWLLGVAAGLSSWLILCSALILLNTPFPGFLLPAAVLAGASVISTSYLRRSRTDKTDIFISYKRNADVVPRWLEWRIYSSLRTIRVPGERYANVFFDRKKLELSQDWKDMVKRAIDDECAIFIPIVSKEYVDEVSRCPVDWHPEQPSKVAGEPRPCAYELYYALHQQRVRMCPIWLEGTPRASKETGHPLLQRLAASTGQEVENGKFDFKRFRSDVEKLAASNFRPSDQTA